MFKDIKIKHLPQYLNERFPLVNMFLFIVLYAMVFSVYDRLKLEHSHQFFFHVCGAFAVISFFFRLRVFDEMKDFELDLINHPKRILQSGKINLITLQGIALLTLIAEIIWVYSAGKQSFYYWLIAFLYAVAMRYEFFIPKILNRNLLLYAITHMFIMPLIIVWVWMSLGANHEINEPLLYLFLLSLISGFAFEIARKTRAPEFERDTVDSYSKQLGLNNAQWLIIGLCVLMTASLMMLFRLLNVPMYAYLLNGLLCFWIIIEYYKTIRKADEQSLRKNEKKVSLMMLVSYLSLILLNLI